MSNSTPNLLPDSTNFNDQEMRSQAWLALQSYGIDLTSEQLDTLVEKFRYLHENPKCLNEAHEVRQARLNDGRINDFTEKQWRWLVEQYEGKCAYCGCVPLKPLQREHVVPVVRGGAHTISNIVPACRRCNLKKSARTPEQAGMVFVIRINILSRMKQQSMF
jgi:5-methylcytosine-specific restriction endonuclease McrA